MTRPNFIKLTDEQVRARKRRNVAIALGLVGFIVLASIIIHGVTATPLLERLAKWRTAKTA